MGLLCEIDSAEISTHVFTRILNFEQCLAGDWPKSLFVSMMWYITENYPIELNALTILDDHVHMIFTTPNDDQILPEAMKVAKSMFTRHYNKTIRRIGPLWNNRYGRKYFEQSKNPDLYALISLWYCAYNPVRKGYVSKPGMYEYDTINHYIIPDYQGILPVTRHKTYMDLHEDENERISEFLKYEEKFKNTLLLKSRILDCQFDINPKLTL
ncbi:MAG: transposase [Spirochaetes bacterium]|nr:transposase [Spirochaetota bacterium]